MLDRPALRMLLIGALALSGAACAHPGPAPGTQTDRPAPSEGLLRCQHLQSEAEALARRVDRGQPPSDAGARAERIAARLVELEEQVGRLPRAERPHARRLVDQTLALLDSIREQLAIREEP